MAGSLVGVLGGLMLERRFIRFEPPEKVWQKIVAFIFGAILPIVAVIVIGKPVMAAIEACGEAAELSELLSKTEKLGITPLYIHDRPEKTVMGRYVRLIECEGGGFNEFTEISNGSELELQYRGAFSVK